MIDNDLGEDSVLLVRGASLKDGSAAAPAYQRLAQDLKCQNY